MGMNIDDEQLLRYLLKFVTGMPIQCDRIRLVDLYGDKKPSQLFDTTTANHHYVFTQLKKMRKNGRNFNRGIVDGDGRWKKINSSKPVYDKERSVIGFKKSYRFDERNQAWYMKEIRLSDKILEDLRGRGQIRFEESVVCRIRRKVNADHIRHNFLASSSSQCQESVKSFAQEYQDLVLKESSVTAANEEEECSVPGVHQGTPSVSLVTKEPNVLGANEEFSVPVVHQETPSVSLVTKESIVPAAIAEECSGPAVHQYTPSVILVLKVSNVTAAKEEEECSVPVVHLGTPSVSLVLKESNVAATNEEECSVPVVHQETPLASFVAKESNVAATKEEEECSVRHNYDIATYYKELDAYAASVLETMVPYIPEPQEDEDQIPLFCEDFYIGHTNLWS